MMNIFLGSIKVQKHTNICISNDHSGAQAEVQQGDPTIIAINYDHFQNNNVRDSGNGHGPTDRQPSIVAGLLSSNVEVVASNVEVVANFDVSKYLGMWYEYAKYPQYFEGDGVCITAQYSLQNDGNVAVTNSQINATTGEAEDILSTASVVSNAKLLVKFPVSTSLTVSSNYWVLGTDYCTYSVVYSCQPLANGQSSKSVWILTRQRLPSLETIETALGVLKKSDISLDPLTLTNQVACSN